MTELAIRLRGAVKRYGPITAVDGLDLDVPEGHVRRPARAERRRQVDDDAAADRAVDRRRGRDRGARLHAARRSRRRRARSAASCRSSTTSTSTLTVEQNLLVFAHLYRIPRAERRAAIERALEMAKLVDRRDSRVDKLSGGMRRRLLIARALVHRPRLVLLDEPTVGLDPQVRQELWALIDALRSEGTTILMSTHYIEEAQRLADTVLIMSHGKAVAAGPPAELVLEHAGREVLEVYGPPARLAEVEAEAGAAGLRTRRTGTSVSILGVDGRQRVRDRGRAPAGEPRGRLRPAHRRGDRLMAAAATPTPRLRRLERPAITGVLVREVVNFSSYWRSATFSSTVEPTIYLLAFGFGFGVARQHGRRLRLRRVRRHRHGRDRGALLERVPGDVRDVRQVPVPAHVRRDPGGARRHRGARHRRGALDRHARRRLRLRADARGDGLRARPGVGDAHRAVDRAGRRASAGPASGSRSPATRSRSRTSATSSAPC